MYAPLAIVSAISAPSIKQSAMEGQCICIDLTSRPLTSDTGTPDRTPVDVLATWSLESLADSITDQWRSGVLHTCRSSRLAQPQAVNRCVGRAVALMDVAGVDEVSLAPLDAALRLSQPVAFA